MFSATKHFSQLGHLEPQPEEGGGGPPPVLAKGVTLGYIFNTPRIVTGSPQPAYIVGQ